MAAAINFAESHKRRIATGLFFADAIAGLLFALFGLLTGKSSDISFLGFLVSLVVGVGYSLIVIIVLAMPLFLALNYWKLVNVWSAMISGFVIGILVAAFFGWPSHGIIDFLHLNFKEDAVVRSCIFGVIGIASALGFWSVWKKNEGSL